MCGCISLLPEELWIVHFVFKTVWTGLSAVRDWTGSQPCAMQAKRTFLGKQRIAKNPSTHAHFWGKTHKNHHPKPSLGALLSYSPSTCIIVCGFAAFSSKSQNSATLPLFLLHLPPLRGIGLSPAHCSILCSSSFIPSPQVTAMPTGISTRFTAAPTAPSLLLRLRSEHEVKLPSSHQTQLCASSLPRAAPEWHLHW